MTYDGAGRVLSRTEAPGTPEAATGSYTYDAKQSVMHRSQALLPVSPTRDLKVLYPMSPTRDLKVLYP